mmetsp:Transcript_57839/g.105682  ORF Transcript_57839/g.105682 Transcript_57839/m.105682 type:complete len:225 (-) Transcript_57839:221-895(-)
MILGRDVATGCAHINTRLVHSSVAKFHLVSLRACRKRQDLIAHADPKNGSRWSGFHHFPHMFDECSALSWVAWAVTDEKAVKLILCEVIVPWDHGGLHTERSDQVAQNVVLDAAINYENVHPLASCAVLNDTKSLHWRVLRAPGVFTRISLIKCWRLENLLLLPGNLSNKVRQIWILERQVLGVGAAVNKNFPQDSPCGADQLCQGAGVNTIDSGDAMLFQPRT